MKIGYGQKTALNPPTSWLESAISIRRSALMNGQFNTSDASNLIKIIQNIAFDKSIPFTGNLMLNITSNGTVQGVSTYGLSNIPATYLDAIKQAVIGQKIDPYIYNGQPYPSFKKYNIQFIPNAMSQIHLNETSR